MSVPELVPVSAARGSHLAFTLFWLPRQRRRDALIFYRFCRTVDDIVDDSHRSVSQKQELIQKWLNAISCELPPELECIVQRYGINRSLLAEIVHGCEMDISFSRYSTFSSLEDYCWRVACAVGLVSIRIFGCRDPRSATYAENLGYALQLTNILRDVAEDARMGRIYLPLEDLERFGVSEADLLTGHLDESFLSLMRFEAQRARERYSCLSVPPQDALALLPAEMMRAIYLKILRRLEEENFPVFTRHIRLGRFEQLSAVMSTILLLARGAMGSR